MRAQFKLNIDLRNTKGDLMKSIEIKKGKDYADIIEKYSHDKSVNIYLSLETESSLIMDDFIIYGCKNCVLNPKGLGA